jgi:hypothetical protein
MKKTLLNDPEIFPDDIVLASVLGNSFQLYKQMMDDIAIKQYALNAEWRYYNDGKSWLCKITSGKKTIIWLSVWEGFFRCSIYFHEKYIAEVEALPISKELIENFREGKSYGKLKALSNDIKCADDLNNILSAAFLKKKLK